MNTNKKMNINKESYKEDLRILKTRRALHFALYDLLCNKKFTRITVQDICAKSLVSRTAFYAHYKDKYDLLGKILSEQKEKIRRVYEDRPVSEAVETLCGELKRHLPVIVNLFDDADPDQQRLLYNFLSPDLCGVAAIKDSNGLLTDFLAGGLYRVVQRRLCGRRELPDEELREIISFAHQMMFAYSIAES
jgi:AcrR family transcriptional regulator